MISKRKDDPYNLRLLLIHILEKAWKNKGLKSKIFRKHFEIHFRSGRLSQLG